MPQARSIQLLTNTRLSSLRRCPRQHYYRYELGLAKARPGEPLRFGAAFHVGLEAHNQGLDESLAVEKASAGYNQVPEWADPTEWEVERQTLHQLLAGHFWRYGSDNLDIVASEQSFQTPLLSPGSNFPSRLFLLAGKIDAIVRLSDGRLAILEYKTAGEDIGPHSDYWLRLRYDAQISLYVIAARELGYDVATVLYDVTRKPTIRLRKGETPDEYGQRLLADIGERPDYYYARREIPRLEDDLREFRLELWQQAGQLRDAQKANRWFRNVSKLSCGYCEFAPLCLNAINVSGDAVPPGFVRLEDVHPELSAGGEASTGESA